VVAGGPNAAPILLTTATNIAIPPMMVRATIAPPLMNMLTLQFPTTTCGGEDACHKEGKEGSKRSRVGHLTFSGDRDGCPPSIE